MMMQQIRAKTNKLVVWAVAFSVMIVPVLGYAPQADAMSRSGIIYQMNTKRKAYGKRYLSVNWRLASAAKTKVADMCAKNYWSHTSPSGVRFWTLVRQAGYRYVTAGENLAYGFSSDKSLVTAWMASPGHRANILNSRYREVGVAMKSCKFQGVYTTVVVAHFGARW